METLSEWFETAALMFAGNPFLLLRTSKEPYSAFPFAFRFTYNNTLGITTERLITASNSSVLACTKRPIPERVKMF